MKYCFFKMMISNSVTCRSGIGYNLTSSGMKRLIAHMNTEPLHTAS